MEPDIPVGRLSAFPLCDEQFPTKAVERIFLVAICDGRESKRGRVGGDQRRAPRMMVQGELHGKQAH